MVKWSDTWYEKLDQNGIKYGQWVEKRTSTHALCKLCNCELKFEQQGLQALKQHSSKPKHTQVSKLAFSNTVRRFETTTSSLAPCGEKKLFIAPSLQEKVSAAEAMWIFKIAEEDMTLRDSDNTPKLFQAMFPDSQVAKAFTMGRSKASYILQDGLGPLLSKWLCQTVAKSEGLFTFIFDEATTNQKKKQMDLLLRFWNEELNQIVTRYLGSLYFGRATAADLASMLEDIMNSDEYDIPWERLFFLSSDGPNINKAVWRKLNEKIKGKGYKGLVALITCTLHIMHNAFRKGTSVGGFGEMAEQLAFDLHAWFKVHDIFCNDVPPNDDLYTVTQAFK